MTKFSVISMKEALAMVEPPIVQRLRALCAERYYTLADLGLAVGRTRERVRQLLTLYTLRRAPRPTGPARRPTGRRRSRTEAGWQALPETPCQQCGAIIKEVARAQGRTPSQLRNRIQNNAAGRLWFCIKRCQGLFTAEHYGWGLQKWPGVGSLYHRLRALGVCVRCHKHAARSGRVMCAPCAVRLAENCKRRYAAARGGGQ